MEQLATRCPHCDTRFRVTMAQLELRAGQVRCGACRQIFNGIDTVFELHADEAPALQPPAPADASDRMTLIDFGALRGMPAASTPSTMQDELDALSRAIADLQKQPWSEPPATPQSEFAAEEDDAYAEDAPATAIAAPETTAAPEAAAEPEPPAFVREARRRERRSRTWAVLLWIAIPLLLLTLAAQLAYYFRNDIAARVPQTAPYLRAVCARLGCAIRLPMQIEQLSLASSRLDAQSIEAGRFVLVILLRNRGDTVQTWPSIDLQLKNADGELLVRRAFLPTQYAKPDEIVAGMPARSEREIRLPFELAGEAPAGFEITIFHH